MPEPTSYDDPFEGIFGDRQTARPGSTSMTAPGPVRTPQPAPLASTGPFGSPQAAAVPTRETAPASRQTTVPQSAATLPDEGAAAADAPAPGSRRAAREAAARATGEVPTQSGATPAVPQTAFPVPMPATAPADEPSGFTPLPLRPVRSFPDPLSDEIDDTDDPFSSVRDTDEPGPMRTPNRAADSGPITQTPTAILPQAGRTAEAVQPAPAVQPTAFDLLLPVRDAAAAAASAPVRSAPEPAAATLDDLFATAGGPPSGGGKGKGKGKGGGSRGHSRAGGWVILGIVVVLIGGLVAGGFAVWNSPVGGKVREVMGWTEPIDYASGLAHGEALVTINDGDNGKNVSTALSNAGVTKTSQAFYQYLVKSGQNPTFYPGVYKLQKEMTSAAALKALEDPSTKLQNTALLREGLTEDQILKNLSGSLKIPLDQLQAAAAKPADYGVTAQSLEGWLFPAQYTFGPGVTAQQVIKKMVDRTVQSLDKAGVPVADRERVLIVASIIQREARNTQDFYKVSRVIENRLQPNNKETFGKLQMDSTAQYGYGSLHNGTASSSAEALKDPNPWNTYVHAGLPIGPISSPGDLAIDAAMHPVDGPWLYFTTVNMDTGETVFSTTYADQQKAVQQMRTWCTAHPNSGC
ncbi:endolytic transglycosylase MltG [Microbacterium candidum]|uniref:Endolytic murein transglycosylase n=1 Tax=Microbacterium candidum TaxID=3041922 RepID=A0ABT7MZ87_9MICO|nr:endolytic transglycosylase MltG [Microbacterium sp. ASV49]MDL9979765.1 endolytic transglycosylase MltG [Microbacterium sp. ASV49]